MSARLLEDTFDGVIPSGETRAFPRKAVRKGVRRDARFVEQCAFRGCREKKKKERKKRKRRDDREEGPLGKRGKRDGKERKEKNGGQRGRVEDERETRVERRKGDESHPKRKHGDAGRRDASFHHE